LIEWLTLPLFNPHRTPRKKLESAKTPFLYTTTTAS
jgi:hypothetical protein